MSELSDLKAAVHEMRAGIDGMRQDTTRTATDVAWIRDAMKRETERGDKLTERVGKVERRQYWYAGIFAAVLAALHIGGGSGLKP